VKCFVVASLFLLAAGVVACGPTPAQLPAAGKDDGTTRSAHTFNRVEDELLHDLAALDRRLAVRSHITPTEDDLRRVTMAAMLREDPTVAVNDGSIDPFSFDARARGLEAAKKKLATLPASKPGAPTAAEHELLSRLLDAEVARLEEERRLPRSASALVRAIVETWQAPKDEREAADDDRWLARRLSELRESINNTTSAKVVTPSISLDVVRARELDDALDALEHLTPAPMYTKATQELVRTREALEAAGSRPAAKAPESDWSQVEPRVRAHLGALPPDDLAKNLATLEADLRTRATQAVSAANMSRDALAANLEKVIFVSGPCQDAIPDSRLRSMAAPQEREPSCHLRHFVARGAGDEATTLAALHDHVVIAQWALDVARGAATIAQAQAKHPLLFPVLPDARARYERIALARPVAAIGAGEAARLLFEGAGADLKARATKWSSLGEVPFDIARRELAK
jgi:hypothetical protein